MTKEQFEKDIKALYLEIVSRKAELEGFYEMLEGKTDTKAAEAVEAFIAFVKLPENKEAQLAALKRIVELKEEPMVEVLRAQGASQEAIEEAKERAYGYVSMMHVARFESLLGWIERQKLLSPFYRALLVGVHFVGLRLSEWQSRWSSDILRGANKEIVEHFDGDVAQSIGWLQEHKLLPVDNKGSLSDRGYSALVGDMKRGFEQLPYALAFEKEVAGVVMALRQLVMLLGEHDDEVYGKKGEWIGYFEALIEAFGCTDNGALLEQWQEVDRRWMAIDTPIQVGHPLEYYEDHLRKSVALEWDVRLGGLQEGKAAVISVEVEQMAQKMAERLGSEAMVCYKIAKEQIAKTQLYICEPMLYYAAEFNGLFSAQVVPNDEEVSSELGKKIFAFSEHIRSTKLMRPMMALECEIMGESFVRKQRAFAEHEPKRWHTLYAVSTIGHEYGHILWLKNDTEQKMNRSGSFKNIEEFKATTGGLMAFFEHEDSSLIEAVMDDLIGRAVGLMCYWSVDEILPYYCEGLIHLELLFASKAVRFQKGRIVIDYGAYGALKCIYQEAYEALAKHYIAQRDAGEFLAIYAQKSGDRMMPKSPEVFSFVEHYQRRYEAIGQQLFEA